MKLTKLSIILLSCLALVIQTGFAKTPEELAKESEEASASTGDVAPTVAMVKEKVDKAAALIEKEGEAAFSKMQGKGSEFIFAGTYIWIHDMKGMMRMHPIKYKMNGTDILPIKDPAGKALFVEMNKVAKEKGAGWVDYMWPKPGEKTPSHKISYIKLAKHGSDEFVVGSGMYDLSEDEIKALVNK